MPQDTRSLRSTERPKASDEERFNFDEEEYEINPTFKLKTVNRGYPKAAVGPDMVLSVEEKRKLIGSMVLEVERHELPPGDSKGDMLPDDLYITYHKKMSRHEIRMLDFDLVQGENEADRLLLLSDKLDLAQWQETLKKITVIRNPEDAGEMEKKRLLTKETIDSMLVKYHTMKKNRTITLKNHRSGKIDPVKHWPQIYSKFDRRVILGYHSSSDEEEDGMGTDEIRAHRRKKREKQCRGSIIIQLTMAPHSNQTKYAIVAEPLRSPYVIKISNQERQAWNKKMRGAPEKFINYTQLPSQVAVPIRKVSIPFTLGLQSLNGNHLNGKLVHPNGKPLHSNVHFMEHTGGDTSNKVPVGATTLSVKRMKKK